MAMRTKTRWILWVSTSAALACAGGALAGCGDDTADGGGAGDGGTDATTDSKVNPIDGGHDANVGDADASTDAGTDASDAGDAACTDAQTTCNGACVDITTSAANCGACGHACGGALTCANNHCSNEISSVAAGEFFACALKADGSVWCWGSNEMGELGTSPAAADKTCNGTHCNKTAQRIPGITDARAIAAGRELACAIRDDRSVWCWGKNDFGQLGHAPSSGGDILCEDPTAPVLDDGGVASVACNVAPQKIPLPAGTKVAQVSAGPGVVCARTESTALDGGAFAGDVYCWGNNGHVTVGLPTAAGLTIPTPNKVGVFTSDVIDVAVGGDTRFACAVRLDGTVWCWGDDFQGRLGIVEGTGTDCGGNHCSSTPVQVHLQAASPADAGGADIGLGAPLTGITNVVLGNASGCALKNDGTVWCWGNDSLAALADNGPYDANQHPGARQAPGLASIKTLVRATLSSLAVDGTGAAWGWSDNTFGELGNGTIPGVICPAGGDAGACVAPPAKVPALAGALQLSSSVLLKPDLTVWAWGRNDRAQAGHHPSTGGDLACSSGPGAVNSAPCNPTPAQVTIP